MNNLVTFFIQNKKGDNRLVGIGVTDKLLAHLREKGHILQTGERNKTGVDILLMYAPTDDELVKSITEIMPNKMERQIRVI